MNDRGQAERIRAVLLQLMLITMTIVISFLVIDMITSALGEVERVGAETN